MIGTAMVVASAITINGYSAIASEAPKEKGTDKKQNKNDSKKERRIENQCGIYRIG